MGAIDSLQAMNCPEDAADLQDAYNRLKHNTIPLPAADYPTRPVVPHPLDTIAATEQFMRNAGQEVKETPGQPAPEVLILRLNIMLEELYELAQGFGLEGTFQHMLLDKSSAWLGREGEGPEGKDTAIYNAVEVLDALADGRVVADGTILACGMQQAFIPAMQEVYRSNMSKFPHDVQHAQDTVAHYQRQGVVAEWSTVEDTDANHPLVVRRTEDGKILKALGYSPANLAPILEKYSSL